MEAFVSQTLCPNLHLIQAAFVPVSPIRIQMHVLVVRWLQNQRSVVNHSISGRCSSNQWGTAQGNCGELAGLFGIIAALLQLAPESAFGSNGSSPNPMWRTGTAGIGHVLLNRWALLRRKAVSAFLHRPSGHVSFNLGWAPSPMRRRFFHRIPTRATHN